MKKLRTITLIIIFCVLSVSSLDAQNFKKDMVPKKGKESSFSIKKRKKKKTVIMGIPSYHEWYNRQKKAVKSSS